MTVARAVRGEDSRREKGGPPMTDMTVCGVRSAKIFLAPK